MTVNAAKLSLNYRSRGLFGRHEDFVLRAIASKQTKHHRSKVVTVISVHVYDVREVLICTVNLVGRHLNNSLLLSLRFGTPRITRVLQASYLEIQLAQQLGHLTTY